MTIANGHGDNLWILVFHDKRRIYMHANVVVGNSEESLVNRDVNKKSE